MLDIGLIHGLSRERAGVMYREVFNSGDWSVIGELGKVDRFFLLVWLCDRRDADRDWLYARCREVEASPWGHLDLWARFHYKAVRIDEQVQTLSGWKKHGDLEAGDYVFGVDGRPVRVIARTEVFTDADCYRVTFDKGYSVVVSGDHLWTVGVHSRKRVGELREGRRTVTINTRDLLVETQLAQKVGCRVLPSVPVCGPLQFPHISPCIDPYTLGAWLGDGTSSAGQVSCGDNEVFERIASVRDVGADNTPLKTAARRTVYGMQTQLKTLGLFRNKHIPEAYQRASVAQRTALLQGLMDTDGHCDTRGTATFVNTNEALAGGVFDLAAGLGLKPGIRRHMGIYKGEDYPFWHVSFQARMDGVEVFGLPRKQSRATSGKTTRSGRHAIVSVEPAASEPCSCIQVEGGQYLIGRHMIPTHNSTLITFAGIIQAIIRNPEERISIFSHDNSMAKSFLGQIKTEFEDNRRLKLAYPGVLYDRPQRDSPRWSVDAGIIVKRSGNPKEATVEAHGLIDGLPTGSHFTQLYYDDIATEKNVTTPEQIAKLLQGWELSRLLVTEDSRSAYVGTRYHLADVYRTIADRGAAVERCYPATDDGTAGGEPVLLTREHLERLRDVELGPFVFSAQMLLNPVADEKQGFSREWLRYWPGGDGRGMNVYVVVDPANEKKKNSDYTAAWVIGLNRDRNYYVLDIVRDRLNLTQRADMLFDLHRKWRPLAVGYEKYGKDSDIQHFEDRMRRENYRFELVELGGQMRKHDRIRRLVPLFQNKRIYLPEVLFRNSDNKNTDLVKRFVEHEYLAFPVGGHDDMLDALARIDDPEFEVVWPDTSNARPLKYPKRAIV